MTTEQERARAHLRGQLVHDALTTAWEEHQGTGVHDDRGNTHFMDEEETLRYRYDRKEGLTKDEDKPRRVILSVRMQEAARGTMHDAYVPLTDAIRIADEEIDEAVTVARRQDEFMWGHELGMVGHKIASEAVRRILAGKALGQPSLYNIIRETVIDIIEEER